MEEPDAFGTNADGTKNGEYCSHCYREGRFVNPNLSQEEMIKLVAGILSEEMGFDDAKALEVARGTIPKLKRWRS
jgi:hypothetical protein